MKAPDDAHTVSARSGRARARIRTGMPAAYLGLILLIVLLPGSSGSEHAEIGLVTATKLNMRSAPALDAPVITLLERGTRVRVVRHADGWLEISHDGVSGYVRHREAYIHIIPSPAATAGPDADSGPLQDYRQRAESIAEEIQTGQQRLESITAEETGLLNDLDRLDRSLADARRSRVATKVQIDALDEKIEKTSGAYERLHKDIRIAEVYIAKRLRALNKLQHLGSLQLLASAESLDDLLRRRYALKKILAYDNAVREKQIHQRSELKRLLTELNAQKAQKLALDATQKKQEALIARKRSQRAKILARIREEKSLELASLRALRDAAKALEDKIRALQAAPSQASPGKSFKARKGLLKMPVKGKIINLFGPYTHKEYRVTNFRSGIDIRADRGEPIRAVSAGTAIFASWFKGYGNMLIIDHGRSYYTVYANADELFKQKGDPVEMGEVIATVGDSASLIGPKLYFEIRHHGKPLDPLEWFAKS